MINKTLQRPWWKEPMIWLVAGLPAIAVIASFTTYFIAANNPDSLVNAGYQKIGLAPNQDTSRETRAASLGMVGELRINDGVAMLKLSGHPDAIPARLELLLLHPTQSDHDMRIQLDSIRPAEYAGAMPSINPGQWQWILQSNDDTWRLVGELTLPLNGMMILGSKALQ